MSKEVDVDQLREKLDEVIASVEAGETVEIVKDGRSIATVAPVRAHGGVRYPFRDLQITPLERPLGVDIVQMLSEDREDSWFRRNSQS